MGEKSNIGNFFKMGLKTKSAILAYFLLELQLQLFFVNAILILVILASKMGQKTNFMIQKLSTLTTKMLYRKPFFGTFEPPKGYGRVAILVRGGL